MIKYHHKTRESRLTFWATQHNISKGINLKHSNTKQSNLLADSPFGWKDRPTFCIKAFCIRLEIIEIGAFTTPRLDIRMLTRHAQVFEASKSFSPFLKSSNEQCFRILTYRSTLSSMNVKAPSPLTLKFLFKNSFMVPNQT